MTDQIFLINAFLEKNDLPYMIFRRFIIPKNSSGLFNATD